MRLWKANLMKSEEYKSFQRKCLLHEFECTQVNLTPSDPIGIRRNPWYRIPRGTCRMSGNVGISRYQTIPTLSDIQNLLVGIRYQRFR